MNFFRKPDDATRVDLPRAFHAGTPVAPRIGDVFPNFHAETTRGPIDFHPWAAGEWVFLFSHPGAFTPVCTTEMASFGDAQQDFADRGVKVLALSRDRSDDQLRWIAEIDAMFGVGIAFPMVEDVSGRLSEAFGMTHPNEALDRTIRKSFIIDPAMKVRMIFEYPVYVGRSTDETLRVIDALQMLARHQVGTPADWQSGESCLLPHDMSDATADTRYGHKWKKLSHYLKLVDL